MVPFVALLQRGEVNTEFKKRRFELQCCLAHEHPLHTLCYFDGKKRKGEIELTYAVVADFGAPASN